MEGWRVCAFPPLRSSSPSLSRQSVSSVEYTLQFRSPQHSVDDPSSVLGGGSLLAHCLSTCRPSVPVHSTVNYYVVFTRFNDDADPRSWSNFLLSSTSRLGPLVHKRKGTPRNSSNQVIIPGENVQIQNDSQYNDTTTDKPFM